MKPIYNKCIVMYNVLKCQQRNIYKLHVDEWFPFTNWKYTCGTVSVYHWKKIHEHKSVIIQGLLSLMIWNRILCLYDLVALNMFNDPQGVKTTTYYWREERPSGYLLILDICHLKDWMMNFYSIKCCSLLMTKICFGCFGFDMWLVYTVMFKF